jgi:hypothetical protein
VPRPSSRGLGTSVRYAVLRDLADHIVALRPGERVTVAVDGFDGVGKTVLADQLAEVIGAVDGSRHVLRVSIDGSTGRRLSASRGAVDPRPSTRTPTTTPRSAGRSSIRSDEASP